MQIHTTFPQPQRTQFPKMFGRKPVAANVIQIKRELGTLRGRLGTCDQSTRVGAVTALVIRDRIADLTRRLSGIEEAAAQRQWQECSR